MVTIIINQGPATDVCLEENAATVLSCISGNIFYTQTGATLTI